MTLSLLAFSAACGGGTNTTTMDMATTTVLDFTVLPGADLTNTTTADLTSTMGADMTATMGADMTATMGADMTGSDMTATMTADMTFLADLTVLPDMTASPPDLFGVDLTGADLATVPDLVVVADLKTNPDMVSVADMRVATDMVSVGGPIVSGNFYILGITTDDNIFYMDATAFTFNVVSINGGSPTVLATFASFNAPTAGAFVDGKSILIWENLDQNTSAGTFSVWTQTNGKQTATGTSVLYAGTASPDGLNVAFADGAVFAGDVMTANYVRATTAAPNTKTTLQMNAVIYDAQVTPTCPLQARAAFAGNTHVIIAACVGSGTTYPTDAYTLAGVKANLLASTEGFWANDTAGTKVLVQGDTAATWPMRLVNIDGTSPTTVQATNTNSLYVTKDGSGALWTDYTNGHVRRVATATPTVITEVTTQGMGAILALSPDETRVIGYNVQPSAAGLTALVIASSTTANQTPTSVVATSTALAYGRMPGFTSDSGFLVYMTGVFIDTNGDALDGSLITRPVGSTTTTSRSTNVYSAKAGVGSKVVFNDAFNRSTYTANIKVVDAANANAATSLATGADSDLVLSAAKTKVGYTSHTATPNGLYAVTVP